MPPGSDPDDQARAVLALMPLIRQWAMARVQSTGLSLRQYLALETIHHGAASPGDIARLWNVTPGTLTGIIDRLEARGMVQREPDSADRRRSRLVLTGAGDAARAEIEQVLVGDLAVQLAAAAAGPEEHLALDTSLDILHRSLAALQNAVSPVSSMGEESILPNNKPDDADDENVAPVDESTAGTCGGSTRSSR